MSVVITLKHSLAALCVATVLAGAVSSLANAQTATPAPSEQTSRPLYRQQFLDALAKRLGIATPQLEQAMAGARADVGPPPAGTATRSWHRAGLIGTLAPLIGITPQQLRQELPGKSLAMVAEAHGKNPADVATALKNAANARIDQHVSAGRLTADQAAQRKQAVDQRIDQGMNRVLPAGDAAPIGT